MKLESLKNKKFKNSLLNKEQLFLLNGGNTKTGGGNFTRWEGDNCYNIEYSYDVDRGNGLITNHGFTKKTNCSPC